jgi:predicted enzyme related to lactoylglutathione lyase
MPERTQHAPGTFSWVDLSTTDTEGAKAFYSSLLGWDFDDQPIPEEAGGGVYTMVLKRGKQAGALAPAQPGQATAWNSYVTVESADDAAAKAGELGGQLLAEPFDVMDAGRMAIIQDPNGAVFSVWQPNQTIGAGIVNEPGALTHNQINTSNPDDSETFYSGLFGWRFDRVPDTDQAYWGIYNGDRLNGGMLQEPPDMWLVYFGTEDVDADAPRIAELGGTVVVEPLTIPGGGRILVATDPQGAVFALFSGRFDD